MNQQFSPPDACFAPLHIPENVQAIAEQSVVQSRAAYEQMSSAAKRSARLVEDMVSVAQDTTKAMGQKVLENASKNSDALFAAAAAMARAKTFHELVALQTDFVQRQFALANEQSHELLDLSTTLSKKTFERLASIGSATFVADPR
jgi:hypothetical protein